MDLTMKLTAHFTLNEALRSKKATELKVANTPTVAELATIHRTAIRMEIVRDVLGVPIVPSSWFRNEVVNKAVGGQPNSQHRKGEAVDFSCPDKSHNWIVQTILENADIVLFDQLILEPNWVHISFTTSHVSPRKDPRFQYLDLSKQ
jgi:Peptidase M15.